LHFKNDDELASAILKGNESAFQFLINEYLPRIVSFLMRKLDITHDEAMDFANDGIEDAFMKIDKYDSRKGKLLAWMGTIAKNAAINKLQRRKSVPTEQMLVDPPMGYHAPLTNEESREGILVRNELNSAIEKLGMDDRKMVQLLLQERTNQEMAQILVVSNAAVRQRKRRLIEKLRKILKNSPAFRQIFLKENERRNGEGKCGFQEEDG